jgi:hypothetical protein
VLSGDPNAQNRIRDAVLRADTAMELVALHRSPVA